MTYELHLPSPDDVRGHLGMLRDTDLLPPGSLHLLVGDLHSCAKMAIFVDDVPDEPPLAERVRVLEHSLGALTEMVTVHGVVLAVSRAGPAELTPSDIDWRDAFTAATASAETQSHGVYVVSPRSVHQVVDSGSPAT